MRTLLFGVIVAMHLITSAQHTVYLFPGQGSDHRIYEGLIIPDARMVYMTLPTPDEGETLSVYAKRFLPQIDTTESFSLVGVSLGGMICAELADLIKPQHVILISSAKHCGELPLRYSFQQRIPINRWVPASWYRTGALVLQPLVEPDRRANADTFKAMLGAKDGDYLKRTADMIIHWGRSEHNASIHHIHGNKDHTIPIGRVKASYIVEGGSHMMVLTRAEEIHPLIVERLQIK